MEICGRRKKTGIFAKFRFCYFFRAHISLFCCFNKAVLLSSFIKRRFVLIFRRSVLFRRIEGVVRSGGVLTLKFAAVLLMLKRV